MFWKVEKPAGPYKLKVFGFPYQRHWEEIGEFVTSSQNNGYYWTNENQSISDYYVPYSVDSDKAGFYIHIYHPQSFKDGLTNDKVRYWIKHHLPVKIFTNDQKVVAEVYLMPAGNIDEIRGAGD